MYADEKVIRLVALQVFIIAIVALVGRWEYPFLFLAIDFFLRAFTQAPSPLATLAKAIARAIHWKPRPIFAAPKKFAAGLGFVFSVLVFSFFALQWYPPGLIIGAVLVFCAFLESAFRVCLGCYVFNFIVVTLKMKVGFAERVSVRHDK